MAKSKAKFFDMKNIVTSFKGMGVGIATSATTIVFAWATNYAIRSWEMPLVTLILGILAVSVYLLSWGYFAKEFWGWK